MYPRTHLLGLPRELRDEIWKAYITVDGGYMYDFQSGKLIAADGQPIHLALMYTCRLIAEEMKGLALCLNSVTFSTVYSDDLRLRAGKFEALLNEVHEEEVRILYNRVDITEDHVNQVASEYPQFREVLSQLHSDPSAWELLVSCSVTHNNACGETPSLFRQFVHRALQLAVKLPNVADCGRDAHALVSLRHVPWKIPTGRDVKEMVRVIRKARYRVELGFYPSDDLSMYRFSAAAATIHFLQSVDQAIRKQIRRIVMIEDRPSVAYPECHAQGLIQFCQENPLLRVERRANLWRNLLLQDYSGRPLDFRAGIGEAQLHSRDIVNSVALWMVEAHALESLGMPAGSFRLIFNGDPTPEHTTEIFQVVQKYAAWQTALDEAYKRHLTRNPSYIMRRKHSCYFYEAFPKVLKDMMAGDSTISCDFDPGELVDFEQILEECREWSANYWEEASPSINPWKFNTVPPLPSFKEVLAENVLPDPTT